MSTPEKGAAELRILNSDELESAFNLRWRVLREPLGETRGSERDEFEFVDTTVHVGAYDQGTLIGAGRMHKVEKYTMQVRYMAVAPEFRGQGIGGEILRFMEDTARSHGGRAIIMNARKAALNLYERAGYERVSDEITLHGIPHYRMKKQIG